MKRSPISRFEKMAQRLVEDSFRRLFGGRLELPEVASKLAKALEDSALHGRAADSYEIYLHAEDLALILEENPEVVDDLAAYVTRLVQESGLTLRSHPDIYLVDDPAVARHHMRVEASHQPRPEGQTTQLHPLKPEDDRSLEALLALDAFLIIEGRRHLPITKAQLSLGRLIDNDVVLEAPTVSRRHAQIRWRYGRFVLYDLGGRGRTAVNGKPVTESVLQPGDVILLSNVAIIYGEGYDEHKQPPVVDDDSTGRTLLMPK